MSFHNSVWQVQRKKSSFKLQQQLSWTKLKVLTEYFSDTITPVIYGFEFKKLQFHSKSSRMNKQWQKL